MTDAPQHLGAWLREMYLVPRKINVTEAAKLIGVSRPGVSNFLNGKVSATEHMASRIEATFSIPKATLLKMQAEHDAAAAATEGVPAGTKRYVPPFLAIKANEIVAWADHHISARIRLSVMLRTLVHSTGFGLEQAAFPGNDDAERAGGDGFTKAAAGTPWVPAGESGWEFAVTQDVKGKGGRRLRQERQGSQACRAEDHHLHLCYPAPLARERLIDQADAFQETLEGCQGL